MQKLEKIIVTKPPIEIRMFLQGRGKTEWPRALDIVARTQGVEVVSLS